MTFRNFAVAATALAAALGCMPASAATITSDTLPDYNGARYDYVYRKNLGTIGAFTWEIAPDAVITAAFLEGSYGTAAMPYSTAAFDAWVDGYDVQVCADGAAGCYIGNDGTTRNFSIALPSASFARLLDGYATLTLIQTGDGRVRLGSPTLRIETADTAAGAVPEPATWGLMLLGFGMLGAGLRTRRTRAAVAL